jgi:hypothetical protein
MSCASTQEPVRIEEPKWPRSYEGGGDKVVVYEPQVDPDWKDFKKLHARSAVVVNEKTYGVIEYDVDTEVDRDTRDVLFKNRKFTGIRVPGKDSGEIIRRLLPSSRSVIIPLDFVLAYIQGQESKDAPVKVNLDPPPIFVSEQPAILVIFMGPPDFKPVPGLNLKFAVNTNWDVFQDATTSQYYLLNGQGWITAPDLQKGPWSTATNLPSDFWKLPADKNWEDVRGQLPGRSMPAPKVYYAQQPSELILIDGRPVYEAIPTTRLSFISNTDSDVFYDETEAKYYFLTSGRWFRADRLEGPWLAATLDLPKEFAKIPKDHEKADVLPQVPGTQEAADAVLLAQVPQRATVDRKSVTVSVTYDGAPKFTAIEGTKVQYAVNSPYSVFLVNGTYYCCHQAVWFQSSATGGPWVVCSSVPSEIYTIPSTHPSYPVTYVKVTSSTPDVVVVETTSGYEGAYIAAGTVMFGMGLAMMWGASYNHYHYGPAYYGYGCGAHYSYNHGGYYSGGRAYGPYGGAGWGASYNPATGNYSRGASASGPRGSRYFQEAYNPYTDRYAARSGGSTPYGNWSRGVAAEGNDWARGGRVSNTRGTVAAGETSEGARAAAARSNRTGNTAAVGRDKSGDLYAGRNGEVYRQNDGQWQHRDGDKWSNVQKPETQRNLQSDSSTRDRGWQNTERQSTRSSGQTRSRGGGGRGGRR